MCPSLFIENHRHSKRRWEWPCGTCKKCNHVESWSWWLNQIPIFYDAQMLVDTHFAHQIRTSAHGPVSHEILNLRSAPFSSFASSWLFISMRIFSALSETRFNHYKMFFSWQCIILFVDVVRSNCRLIWALLVETRCSPSIATTLCSTLRRDLSVMVTQPSLSRIQHAGHSRFKLCSVLACVWHERFMNFGGWLKAFWKRALQNSWGTSNLCAQCQWSWTPSCSDWLPLPKPLRPNGTGVGTTRCFVRLKLSFHLSFLRFCEKVCFCFRWASFNFSVHLKIGSDQRCPHSCSVSDRCGRTRTLQFKELSRTISRSRVLGPRAGLQPTTRAHPENDQHPERAATCAERNFGMYACKLFARWCL